MKRFATFLGLAVGLAIWLGLPSTAEASSRFHVGLNIHAPQPRVQRVWVPGTFITRTERVLVQNAHYVNHWVPPVYETRYDRHRRPYTVCIRKGHHQRVLIPARYEMRTVRDWVPGYWQTVQAPRHRPFLSLFFGKNDHHRGHSTHRVGHVGHNDHGCRGGRARF